MPHWSITKLKNINAKIQALLQDTEMDLPEDKHMSPGQKFGLFWLLVWRQYLDNRCFVHAAGLAYTTVLAIVPVLAVVMSISTGLLQQQGREPIEQFINYLVANVAPQLNLTPDDEEEAEIARLTLVTKIQEYVENIHSGALGVTAIVLLVFVAITLLSSIESTFNDMWGVRQGRTWFSRIIQYWTALSLGPILLLLALGLTTSKQFEAGRDLIQQLPIIGKLGLQILPILILSLALALIYLLMPNTKVDWRAALVGGLVAGVLLHLNHLFSVIYASRVIMYDRIYGSLSIVPLFLIGLFFSWIIVLLGAQVAYVFQNRQAYLQEQQARKINQRGREFIALRLMTFIAQRFQYRLPTPTKSEMSHQLEVPLNLTTKILDILLRSKLVIETLTDDGETGYAPGGPLDQITENDIFQAMRTGQGQELPTSDDSVRPLVRGDFEAVQKAEMDVASNISLLMLVERIEIAQNPSITNETEPKETDRPKSPQPQPS